MNQKVNKRWEIQNYLDTIEFLNEGMNDYFFIWDIDERHIFFTGDVYKKYPLPFRGEEGNTLEECRDIVYARDRKRFEKQMQLMMYGRLEICSMECRAVDKEGKRQWVNCRMKSRVDEHGKPRWIVGRVSGTELLRKIDSLTGIFNGDKFVEDMQKCHESGRFGYLLVLGIDNLKTINIKHGRNFGNQILKTVTRVMEEQVDASMNIYRVDGNRFAVMLPEAEEEDVENLYQKIQKNLEEYCTVSAGAAFCSPSCGADCGTIYQYAEDALDCAKTKGTNMLVFFSYDSYQKRLDTIRLQEEMHQSVQEDCRGFYLCFQPLVENQKYHIWGCEALLRYRSPSHGIVGPVEFIPLLEQTELICPVGDWVLKTALAQCREWRKVMPDFHVNVNVSYVQLRKEGICERVLELLRESGLSGDALTLEVTESMQLQDYAYFNQIFFQWKMAGINIAIDDFGTGYSSLSYLKSLEIDEIKIDRCFVSNIHQSAYNYRLLSNVIELAHSAEIKVCCEGVETAEELETLRQLQPDVLQGYLFGKPCEKEEFENKYHNRTEE